MHRLKLLGLALIAVFVLGAIASSAASAENPEILPAPTEKEALNFTSVGGAVNLVFAGGATTIKCEKVTNKGKFTAVNLGAITLDLINCKAGVVKCWSLGDEASGAKKETILINADFHLVDILPGGVLTLGMAITFLTLLHIECQGGLLILGRGTIIGRAGKVTSGVKTKTATLEDKQTKGVDEITECDLDKAFCNETKEGKEVHKKLEPSFEMGKGFESVGVEAEDEITFEKEVAFDF